MFWYARFFIIFVLVLNLLSSCTSGGSSGGAKDQNPKNPPAQKEEKPQDPRRSTSSLDTSLDTASHVETGTRVSITTSESTSSTATLSEVAKEDTERANSESNLPLSEKEKLPIGDTSTSNALSEVKKEEKNPIKEDGSLIESFSEEQEDDTDLILPPLRELNAEEKTKKDSWIKTLKDMKAQKIQKPDSLEVYISEVAKRVPEKKQKKDIKEDSNQVQQCKVKYQNQWKQVLLKIQDIERTDCWNEDQKNNLNKYKLNLEQISDKDLASIQENYLRVQNLLSYCRTKEFLKRDNPPIPDGEATFPKEVATDEVTAHQENTNGGFWAFIRSFIPGSSPKNPEKVEEPKKFQEQINDSDNEVKHSDKLLLHLVGDVFGMGSGLEGMQISRVDLQSENSFQFLAFRIRVLNKIKDVLKHRSYIKDKVQANPCEDMKDIPKQEEYGVAPYRDVPIETLEKYISETEFARKLSHKIHETENNKFIDFENAYKEAIRTLKEKGDHFFFQGGWQGHAVVYEVSKDDSDTYTFKVFNSGEGLQYHLKQMVGSSEIFNPYIQKSYVSLSNLQSKGFLKVLYDLANDVYNTGVLSLEGVLYHAIKNILDGSLLSKKPSLEDFLDPQISGTCGYFSVPYYYKSKSEDKTLSDFIEFHMQFIGMEEYFLQNRLRIESAYPLPYNLANESLVFFSEKVASDSRHKKKHLDDGLHVFASEKIQSYYDTLKLAFSLKKLVKENDNKRDIQNIGSREQELKVDLKIPENDFEKNVVQISFLKNAENWEVKKEKIHEDLQDFISKIAESLSILEVTDNKKDYTQGAYVLGTLLLLIQKLPNREFWKSFSENELVEILEDLRSIDELFFRSIYDRFYENQNEGIYSIEYLAQIKILTLGDILRSEIQSKNPSSSIKGVDSILIEEVKPYFEGKIAAFVIQDAKWNQEFTWIKDYWEKSRIEDFFNAKSEWCQLYLTRSVDSSNLAAMFSECSVYSPKDSHENAWFLQKALDNNSQDGIQNFIKLLEGKKEGESFAGANSVYSLRTLSVFTQLFSLFESFVRTRIEWHFVDHTHNGLTKECRFEKYETEPYIRCSYSVFGRAIYFNKLEKSFNLILSKNNNFLEWKASKGLRDAIVSYSNERQRKTSNQLMAERYQTSEYPLDMVRQVAIISQQREAQIAQTLGYFSKNYVYLTQDEWRSIYKTLIFDPGLLEEEAQKNPLLSKQLGQFCKDRYKEAKESNNLSHGEYFLRLNQFYLEHMQYVHEKNPKIAFSKSDFLDTKKILIENIVDGYKDDEFLNLYFRDLLRTYKYQNSFTEKEDVKWFIIASLYRNIHTPKISLEHDLENEIASILVKKSEYLRGFFKNVNNYEVLTEVVQYFVRDFKVDSSLWNNQFPLFVLDNNGMEIKLDCANSKLFINGSVSEEFPSEILHHRDFHKFFKWPFEEIPLKIGDLYEVVVKEGAKKVRYRIAKDAKGLMIRRNWGHRWYQLMSDSEVLTYTQNAEKNWSYKNKKIGLFPGFSHWISVRNSSAQQGYVNIESSLAYADQKTKDPEILVFKEKQSQLAMVMFLSEDASSVKEVLQVQNGSLTDFKLYPLFKDSFYFPIFNKIEDPRYVFIWKSPTRAKVDFPRLNLSLNIDETRKEISSNEYGVLKKTIIPTLFQLSNYLVFEKQDKKNHERKFETILIPHFEANVSSTQRMQTETIKTNFDSNNVKLGSIPVYVYKYNAALDFLQAFGTESKLFLAYLHFINQQYESSLERIEELSSHVGVFSEVELKTLRWMILSDDRNPMGLVLRLKALILVIQNSSRFDFEQISKFINTIQSTKMGVKFVDPLYKMYLQQRARIGKHWLSESEELWLYYKDILKLKEDVLFSNRYAEILKLENSILQTSEYGVNDSFKHEVYLSVLSNVLVRSDICSLYDVEETRTVLFKSSIANNFHELYKIAKSYSQDGVEDKIREVFRKTGLGETSEPKVDFISFLQAVELIPKKEKAVNEDKKMESRLSGFLLAVIRSRPDRQKNLPELKTICSNIKEADFFDRRTYEATERANLKYLEDQFWFLSPEYEISPSVFRYSDEEILARKAQMNTVFEAEWDIPASIISKDKIKLDAYSKNYTLEKPVYEVAKIEKYIAKSVLDEREKQKHENFSKTLKDVFVTSRGLKASPKFKREVEDLHDKIDVRTEILMKTPQYTISNLEEFKKEIEQDLQTKSADLSPKIEEYRQKILDIMDKEDEDWVQRAKYLVERVGQLRKKPRLESVLRYYANENYAEIYKLNPVLKEKDVEELLCLVKEYLVLSTYKNKVDEIHRLALALIKNYERMNIEERQQELENFIESATQTRSYNLDEKPSYLVFENFMGFIIRKEQVDAIRDLNLKKAMELNPETKGAMRELIMGSGKTSVLLPLISFENSGPEALSVVIFPESLMTSMSQQIYEQMMQVFGRKVEVLEFKRSHKMTASDLQDVYERLNRSLEEKRLVIMSNSSVQSLYLMSMENMRDCSELCSKDKAQSLRIYRNILSFFKKYAYVTIDEVDSVLDIMKAHRFSLGYQQEVMNRDAYFATLGLYNLLVESRKIQDILQIPFLSKQGSRSLRIFNEHYYSSTVLPKVIAELVDFNNVDHLFFYDLQDSNIKDLYKNLSGPDLRKYLNSKDDSWNAKYLATIENELLRGYLAALYTQIHQIIPMTFEKLFKVHYGLFPKSKCSSGVYCPEFVAIPYHSGVPLLESRFGSDLEALNYTLQSHLENHDVLSLLQEELENWKINYKRKNNNNKQIYLKFIHNFLPNITEKRFLELDKNELNPYAEAINQNPKLILKLLVEPLNRHLRMYNHQMSTNPLIYTSLFKKIQGVTGTLWNLDTMADFFDPKKVKYSDTMEKTLMYLWEKSADEVATLKVPLDNASIESRVQALFENRPLGSVIDQGGLFKGYSNEDVAKFILAQANSENKIRNIIYYDKDNAIKVYSNDGSYKDYNPALLNREETIAYWDLPHTTGSDLKVSENDQAVLTVNKNTILRDLMQSAWRLRSLHRGQKANFAMLDSDFEYMKEYLQNNFNRSLIKPGILSKGELIFYTFAKESDARNFQIYRSISLSMVDEIIKPVIHFMMTHEMSNEAYGELYKISKALFEVSFPKKSYEIYGFPVVEIPTKNALSLLKRNVMNRKDLKLLSDSLVNTKEFESRLDLLVAKGLEKLPPRVLSQQKEHFGSELEVETELEMQIESQIEQEIEIKIQNDIQKLPNYERWDWDKDKFLKGETFTELLTEDDLTSSIDEAKKEGKLQPLSEVSSALKERKHSVIAPYFKESETGPKLLCSMNAFPVAVEDAHKLSERFEFFSSKQKPLNDLLVQVDSKGNLKSLSIIDREDSVLLGDWINEDLKAEKPEMKEGLLLFHIDGNFYRYNKIVEDLIKVNNQFLDNLRNSDEFIKLLVKVKYLTTRSSLDEREQQIFMKWIANVKTSSHETRLMTLFEESLGHASQKAYGEYKVSGLYQKIEKRRQLLSRSNHVDLTSKFNKSSDLERQEIKNQVISLVHKNDPGATKETTELVHSILDRDWTHSTEKLLEDALDLEIILVQKGADLHYAVFLIQKPLDSNHENLRSKLQTLGVEIFKQDQGCEAFIDSITSQFFVEDKIEKILSNIYEILKIHSQKLFEKRQHSKNFVREFFKNVFEKDSTIASGVNKNKDLFSNVLVLLAQSKNTTSAMNEQIKSYLESSQNAEILRAFDLSRTLLEKKNLSNELMQHLKTKMSDNLDYFLGQGDDYNIAVCLRLLLALDEAKVFTVNEMQDFFSKLNPPSRDTSDYQIEYQALKNRVESAMAETM